jgi:nicotinamide mononucleotide adenylyltransferase
MKSFKQFFTEQNAPKTIAVYAGRFHPFHIGHAGVYKELANRFGAQNTFITTSGKVDPPNSPFRFMIRY